MLTRANEWEEWLINGGPMPGLDLPEVPMPDTATLKACNSCGKFGCRRLGCWYDADPEEMYNDEKGIL